MCLRGHVLMHGTGNVTDLTQILHAYYTIQMNPYQILAHNTDNYILYKFFFEFKRFFFKLFNSLLTDCIWNKKIK